MPSTYPATQVPPTARTIELYWSSPRLVAHRASLARGESAERLGAPAPGHGRAAGC